ncbi:DUF3130 family protein [Enterococcus termitis]|uniref:Uncharacterized protein n=1 Tax=Enterococcus termitis TaxID=332950 RepID=A0A1E5H513_9ENTE|nr:DUF3130 family protein [Enterococcus termitis]OEG20003.1 hypothetical protein BCR25_14535 [Enterococcus termitis]OJG97793.1 hypothetical protein RV18_GL000610 [Enterococcus termitis]
MIKNDMDKAQAIAKKIASANDVSIDMRAKISYSSSSAVSELESCVSDLTALVQQFSANTKVDSVNVIQVALALKQADKKSAEVVAGHE